MADAVADPEDSKRPQQGRAGATGAQPDHQTAQTPGRRQTRASRSTALTCLQLVPQAGWFRRMRPATVLDVLLAGSSVVGLVIGDQQHSGNLLRVLDGEPVVAREVSVRPERLGRIDRLTPQRHALLIDRAGIHSRVGYFIGAVEAVVEVDLVTFGGHLRMGLKAPVNDLGGDAERLPGRVLDLHLDTGLTALCRRVGAAPEGRAAGQGENHQSQRGTGKYPCGEH